jgi:hypothetical protein
MRSDPSFALTPVSPCQTTLVADTSRPAKIAFSWKGDFDYDGDVDDDDEAFIDDCITAGQIPNPDTDGCQRADFDGDGTVDGDDKTEWESYETGSKTCPGE